MASLTASLALAPRAAATRRCAARRALSAPALTAAPARRQRASSARVSAKMGGGDDKGEATGITRKAEPEEARCRPGRCTLRVPGLCHKRN
jgi:hypothetical protein